MSLIEAIPNVSEGKSPPVVEAIATSFTEVSGMWLLDTHMDPSHHRSVVTAVGRMDAIVEASCRLAASTVERIDLTHHSGEHPRIGALDVLPFVPLGGTSRKDTVELARTVAREIAHRLELPVFLYGEASSASPLALRELRRGGLAGLRDRLTEGVIVPDFGPRQLHPTAGATAVGVRDFLIAYNVALSTRDVSVARGIARTIRASNGGLSGVQALGVSLTHRNLVQVSMNLIDIRTTGLATAFEAVRHEATVRGVTIDHSEIVGLIPAEARFDNMREKLQLLEDPKILEETMAEAGVA